MAQTGENDFSVLWNVSSKIKILRLDYILQRKDLMKGKLRTEILNIRPIREKIIPGKEATHLIDAADTIIFGKFRFSLGDFNANYFEVKVR